MSCGQNLETQTHLGHFETKTRVQYNSIRWDQYCRSWHMCQVCLPCTLTSPIYEYLRYINLLLCRQTSFYFTEQLGLDVFFLFAATDSKNIRWKKWGWFGRRRVFSYYFTGCPFSFFILWEESGSNLEMNREDWWSVLARWKHNCARNERSSKIPNAWFLDVYWLCCFTHEK